MFGGKSLGDVVDAIGGVLHQIRLGLNAQKREWRRVEKSRWECTRGDGTGSARARMKK